MDSNKMKNEHTLTANDAKTKEALDTLKITNPSYYERRRQSGDLKAFGINPDVIETVEVIPELEKEVKTK